MVIDVFHCAYARKGNKDGAYEARLRGRAEIYEIGTSIPDALAELMVSTEARGLSGNLGDYEVVELDHDPHPHPIKFD